MPSEDLDPAISFRPLHGQRAALKSRAEARGCTVADVVRSAVAQLLAGDPTTRPVTELHLRPKLEAEDDLDDLAGRLAEGGHSL